jgi:C-terminal processing protease CtpA/Prc
MKKAGLWAVLLAVVLAGCATSHLGSSSGRPEVVIPSSNRQVVKTAIVEVFVSKGYVLTSETENALAFVGKLDIGSGYLNKTDLGSSCSSDPRCEIVMMFSSVGNKTKVHANAFTSMQSAFGRTGRGDMTSGKARKQLKSFLEKAKQTVKNGQPIQSFKRPHDYVAKPDKIGTQIGNQIVAGIAPAGPADLAGLQVGDKIITADGNAPNTVKGDQPIQSFEKPHESVAKPGKIDIHIDNQIVAGIAPAGPADLAGLQVGDRIVTADGNAPNTVKNDQPIQSFEQPSEYMAKPGKIGIQIGNQIIASIAPSGPADLAGLQVGDKIVTADGVALNGDNSHDVALIIGDPGTSVRLKILRGDQELEIPVNRGGQPVRSFKQPSEHVAKPSKIGIHIGDQTVAGIAPSGPADRAGLQVGDKIVTADGIAPNTVKGDQPIQSFEKPHESVAKPGKIGIQLGNQIVAGIAPAGPADRAGLQVGDKIVTADGIALNGDNFHDVALIIGDPGTSVRLKILRGDQELEIPVTRGL